jgi:hypothetical protein
MGWGWGVEGVAATAAAGRRRVAILVRGAEERRVRVVVRRDIVVGVGLVVVVGLAICGIEGFLGWTKAYY